MGGGGQLTRKRAVGTQPTIKARQRTA